MPRFARRQGPRPAAPSSSSPRPGPSTAGRRPRVSIPGPPQKEATVGGKQKIGHVLLSGTETLSLTIHRCTSLHRRAPAIRATQLASPVGKNGLENDAPRGARPDDGGRVGAGADVAPRARSRQTACGRRFEFRFVLNSPPQTPPRPRAWLRRRLAASASLNVVAFKFSVNCSLPLPALHTVKMYLVHSA